MNPDKVIHSGDFHKQPFWFNTLNRIWENTYFLGTRIRLDKDDLIRTARKQTDLHDLGREFNEEPFEKLIRSVNEEAGLHAAGRFIARQRFINLLKIRLRAEYFFRKYPAILESDLYPAWIIIGLQRTGTTKLHRLLAADPDHRVIPSWEVINPVPINLDSGTKDKRIAVARTSLKAVRLMSPGFFAIHPIDIHQPEEDILLLDVSFMSTTPEAMMNVPSYASWLETTDQSAAYAYAVRLLKFLQWKTPAKRWILKSPHHLEFPDLIEKHFGPVRFLWPHRQIYESVPSFISMVTFNHMMFSNRVDEKRIAHHWARKTGYMLRKILNYRMTGNNEAKFVDILYEDLVKDSTKELEKIYQVNGGLTKDLIRRFNVHERDHPQRKYGTHQYALSYFGLTEKDIDKQTACYQEFILKNYDRIKTAKIQ